MCANLARIDTPQPDTTDTELNGDGGAASRTPDGLAIELTVPIVSPYCDSTGLKGRMRKSLRTTHSTMLLNAAVSALRGEAVVNTENAAS